MSLYLQLDTGWIARGLLKRKSNYSPIIVFETSDPKRLHQLKEYLLRQPDARYDQYFVYDQWEGLGRLVDSPSGPQFEPFRKRVGSSPLAQRVGTREDGGIQLQFLKSALKEVDAQLKSWRTCFIIQNLSENREHETGLCSALRAWAIDPAVITKGSTVILVTADAERVLDDYTRELTVIVSVDPSSREERAHIVRTTARELEVPLEDTGVEEIVMGTAGLNLHQVESVLLESYFRTQRFDLRVIKDLKSELVKKSGVLEVQEPTLGFGDIGGYEVIKEFIHKYVINVLKHADRARRYALPLPKGILFFGPPGTGKSLFATALASEVQLPFIHLVTENIYSKWLGESGQKMKNAITLAEKMSPAVVFVDEIDRFGRRGVATDSAGEETRRVFSQFLEWLGRPDREAIIVGTTNVPDQLDEAFLRTGRFDYKIPFLYPGEAARLDILLVHLGLKPGTSRRRPPLAIPEDTLRQFLAEEVVPLTANFSGAELEELVTRAKRLAFDRGAEGLEEIDFLRAARTFRVDHRHRAAVIETCLAQARRYTDDQAFLDAVEEEMGVKV